MIKISYETYKRIHLINLSGRFDSVGSQEVNERITSLIDLGHHNLVLNLEKVNYLSSAGIRVLLSLKKRINKLGGDVKLACVQSYTLRILKIADILDDFSFYETVDEAKESFDEAKSIEDDTQQDIETYQSSIGVFQFSKSNNNPSKIRVTGNNLDFLYARCTEDSVVSESLPSIKYSLGIGALGEKLYDYFGCLGELMIVGGTVIWVPTDGHNIPDFLIPIQKSEEVKVHTVYNIILDNTFNEIVRFEANNQNEGVSIDDIYKELFKLSKERKPEFKGILGLVMRADVGAIFGAGIKRAPIKENAPENGKMITHRDNIKDWLNFQVELEYKNTTALVVGVGLVLPSNIDPASIRLIFHSNSESKKTQLLHNHAAIFKFLPASKTGFELEEEINNVILNSEFISMQHLMERSSFKKGIIGLNYIQEIG
jgi:anti-anti-sigma factor